MVCQKCDIEGKENFSSFLKSYKMRRYAQRIPNFYSKGILIQRHSRVYRFLSSLPQSVTADNANGSSDIIKNNGDVKDKVSEYFFDQESDASVPSSSDHPSGDWSHLNSPASSYNSADHSSWMRHLKEINKLNPNNNGNSSSSNRSNIGGIAIDQPKDTSTGTSNSNRQASSNELLLSKPQKVMKNLNSNPTIKIPDASRAKAFVDALDPYLDYLDPSYASLSNEDLGKKVKQSYSEKSPTKSEAMMNAVKEAVLFLRKRGLRADTVRKYKVGLGMFAIRDAARVDNSISDYSQPLPLVQYSCLTFPWICKSGDFDDEVSYAFSPESQLKSPTHQKFGLKEKMEQARKMAREQALKPGDFFTKRFKIRALENKAVQRTYPSGGGQGLFGYHLIDRADNSRIIITEGEFDAMIVHQETGENVVSLPNGARSFPPSLLSAMDRFSEIVLWMDSDEVGRDGCEKIASKLFPRKVLIVSPSDEELQACVGDTDHPYHNKHKESVKKPKDANDLYLQGYDLRKIFDTRKMTNNDEIVKFSDFKQEVASEFDEPDYKRGTRILSFPTLHNMLRGHRRGELTIFSGPTGAGKTTFLSQLSLDICRQGVPTLWGSFEIRNPRLVSHMIQQFAHTNGRSYMKPPPPNDGVNGSQNGNNNGAGKSIEAVEAEADKLALQAKQLFNMYEEEFSQIPMYFMKFFGSTSIDKVISTMETASWNYDVEHIILDNLQFMMGSPSQQRYMNRFDVQDDAISKFRSFCTKHNVHMTLVIHPRKENEAELLTTDSIFGTAKATQEADNLLLLQRKQDGSKYIDVKKNRFSGDTGSIRIGFHKASKCFSEMPMSSPKKN